MGSSRASIPYSRLCLWRWGFCWSHTSSLVPALSLYGKWDGHRIGLVVIDDVVVKF